MTTKDELIKTTSKYVIKLEKGIQDLIINIRKNNEYKTKTICEIVEGLDWCIKVFQITNEFYDEEQISNVTDKLSKIVDCIVSKDDVLLADLLEYEILPSVCIWNENLNKNENEKIIYIENYSNICNYS